MRRIKIPKNFIKIIEHSLENRTNRVITDVGLTKEYKMENGIDQGEIISPLLWIIYYDPVFTKIRREKGIGYKMQHNWQPNLTLKNQLTIEIEIFNITFMDDTTWLSNSKTNLEKQVTIADSFNRFNGTKVNPEKSKLIVINSREKEENNHIKYGKHDTIIHPEKNNSSIRFLGVWISETNNKTFIKKQVIKDVNNIYFLTKGKKITAEMMTYVINMVAILRMEYKANLTIFNENEAQNITTNLRKLLRYKIGLPNTASNAMLGKKEVYNMIDFYDKQTENHITNLVSRLNDKKSLGISTEIRLRQLQQNEWLYNNPLEIWEYDNVNSFKGNIIAQILCLAKSLGLVINITNANM